MRYRRSGSLRLILVFILLAGAALVIVPRIPTLLGVTGMAGAGGFEPIQTTGFSITGVSLNLDEGIAFDTQMTLENPNPIPAVVDRTDYKVYIDDKLAGEESITEQITIPANGKRQVSNHLNINFAGFAGGTLGALGNQLQGEATYVRIEGTMHIEVGPVTFDVPFSNRLTLEELQRRSNS